MAAKRSLVLLHGWGTTARVWDNVVMGLQDEYDLLPVHLPGHGESWLSEVSLQALALELISKLGQMVSDRMVLLGWSLGGLLAIQAALLRPDLVRALLLVASTPVFVQQDGWDAAVSLEEFDNFYRLYKRDPEKSLQRFITLQAQGDINSRQVIKYLQFASASCSSPLGWGLDCLRESNLLSGLSELRMPVHMLFGEQDRLIPRQVASCLADRFGIRADLWRATAHVPFLSDPEKFTGWVRSCLHEEVVCV